MTALEALQHKYFNGQPLSTVEQAIYTLWSDVDGYEQLAAEAAEELAATKQHPITIRKGGKVTSFEIVRVESIGKKTNQRSLTGAERVPVYFVQEA